MKTIPVNLTFLSTEETSSFFDKEIYNLTCTNYFKQPFMFEFMEQPLNEYGITLEQKTFKDIDKSKTWFINADMFPYTWNQLIKNTNKNLFECFPKDILNECSNGLGYIIFNNQNETDTIQTYELFHKLYDRNPIVPLRKIIFMSPSRFAEKIYFEWANEKNLPKDNRFKVINCNHIDVRFNEHDVNYWKDIVENNKNKLFINLNRSPRTQRLFLVSALASLNLLDKGNVSLWYEGSTEQLFRELTYRKDLFDKSHRGKDLYELIYSGIKTIANKLPMFIDHTDSKNNPAGFSSSDKKMYQETYFNLTSTTFFFKWQEPSCGWNEKEWKPIVAKQPFILFGRPGALQAMKDFGILTFNKYIDETYDFIDDDYERFWAILEELTRLSKLSKSELDKMLASMQHILDYNLEYTTYKRWDNIFYTGGLKELLSYI